MSLRTCSRMPRLANACPKHLQSFCNLVPIVSGLYSCWRPVIYVQLMPLTNCYPQQHSLKDYANDRFDFVSAI